MNKQRLFLPVLMILISLILIIAVNEFSPQEVSELPTPTLEVGSISFKFESYAELNFVMQRIDSELPNGSRSYLLPELTGDEEIRDVISEGIIGILISYSELEIAGQDIWDSGQVCKYGGLSIKDTKTFYISYKPSTSNPEFLRYCVDTAPKEIEGYVITLGPGNTATAEKRMFPIEVVFQ